MHLNLYNLHLKFVKLIFTINNTLLKLLIIKSKINEGHLTDLNKIN